MKGRPTYDSNKRCSYQRRQFHWSATNNPISVHHMPQGAKNYVIMSDATYYVLSQEVRLQYIVASSKDTGCGAS